MSSSCAVPHCLPNRNSTIGSALSDADKRKVFQQTRSMHVLRPPRLPDSLGILRRKFKCREKVSVGSRQRERCGVRFSASRDRKLPDRFRPLSVARADPQTTWKRTFPDPALGQEFAHRWMVSRLLSVEPAPALPAPAQPDRIACSIYASGVLRFWTRL